MATDSLEASATLQWNGYHGRVEGDSGWLSVATATQAELGGPGGESNPEELFAAALANCFTSTLTGMARARDIPLGTRRDPRQRRASSRATAAATTSRLPTSRTRVELAGARGRRAEADCRRRAPLPGVPGHRGERRAR